MRAVLVERFGGPDVLQVGEAGATAGWSIGRVARSGREGATCAAAGRGAGTDRGRREVRLSAGSADMPAVDSFGRLVIIEVKLAANAAARRAVVAEVLSYAGYLQGLDPDQLSRRCSAVNWARGGSAPDVAQADDPQHGVDLAASTAADRRAGQCSAARTKFPGSAEFRQAIEDASVGQRDLLKRGCDWAESLERDGLARLVTSRGKLVSCCPADVPPSHEKR